MNHKTEVSEQAMKIAIKYEVASGRTPEKVHRKGVGYDIYSESRSEKRFIEVKGVAEGWSTFSWQNLYYSEVECLKSNPQHFFLYIIHFEKQEYKLFIIPGKELLANFQIRPESFRLTPISRRKLGPYISVF